MYKPNQKSTTILAGILFTILSIGGVVYAGPTDNAGGWAWGGGVTANPAGYDGMGWISFNSSDCDTNNDGKNDNALCGAVNSVVTSYGVNFPSGDGPITGYAWNEYYGWISFNGGDLAGCSPVMASAARVGNALTGGARIMAIKTAVAAGNAGGYDGCIDLSTATI
ncbi:MAG: hypothetical protein RLZZ230_776, partial [Candidatus Parcubacteria bacterium]